MIIQYYLMPRVGTRGPVGMTHAMIDSHAAICGVRPRSRYKIAAVDTVSPTITCFACLRQLRKAQAGPDAVTLSGWDPGAA